MQHFCSKRLLIGLILSFRYLTGSTAHKRAYSRYYAAVGFDTSNVVDPGGVAVICSWFSWNEIGLLMPAVGLDLLEIDIYQATINRPMCQDGRLYLAEEQLYEISNNNFGKYIILFKR